MFPKDFWEKSPRLVVIALIVMKLYTFKVCAASKALLGLNRVNCSFNSLFQSVGKQKTYSVRGAAPSNSSHTTIQSCRVSLKL